MICLKCKSENSGHIEKRKETYPVKGESVTIDANVLVCDCCNETLFDEKLDSENLLKAYREYRTHHKLLQPEEIKAIRERYNLSQKSFAKILGMGEKTITRYENGSIAEETHNNIIELVRNEFVFASLLEKNKSKISSEEYSKAIASIPAKEQIVISNPDVNIRANNFTCECI